ncbi:calcium release-activated calcium channel protein 1 isoform X2 [Anopheles aquasalis]|uniref:calcium release-activated calcium channel protein 1 isoform X2 n=1 Tax=Anopheles aquasalis TaxID=42839 RepID=UPI00215A656A|nr:calcium release-activated calcium channel protein 1 isoform X2 [Anopheles aquasalis]
MKLGVCIFENSVKSVFLCDLIIILVYASGATLSVWSTNATGIDPILAHIVAVPHKSTPENTPNSSSNLAGTLPPLRDPNSTGLNHGHLHMIGNGNNYSGNSNSTYNHTGPSHGLGSCNNRTSICSTHNKRRSHLSTMSQTGDDYHSPNYLSWRKLQLSRAKLKASSKTSALLSGFAMVAMVEVQLDENTKVPTAMLIAFAVCTTLLVAVHMLALMISTCILPNIETVCNLHSISLVHESPHERLHWYIETAWAFSTLLGLILFLLEIAILCWVKFYDLNTTAAWSACIVLIPVLVIFVAFALHFYRSLMTHKYEVTVSGIRELEMLKEQMEQDHLEHHHHHANQQTV